MRLDAACVLFALQVCAGCGARTGLVVRDAAAERDVGAAISDAARADASDAAVTPDDGVDDAGPPDGLRLLAVGGSHTCLVRSGGVLCWGFNGQGQLGDGTMLDRATPTPVIGLSDVVAIAAGGQDELGHTCAVHDGGAVSCWGSNYLGQVGDGTTTDRSVPTPVAGLTDAVQISAGLTQTCVVRAGGSIACWGSNGLGELGDGTTRDSATPVDVLGITDAVEVAAGAFNSCARHATGAVSCWGDADSGALGDGLMTHPSSCGSPCSRSPVRVADIDDARGVATTCALRASGVVCWGYNLLGEVGDGTTTTRLAPVATLGLADAIQIAGGGCALRRDGAALCWGINNAGQLGDGTTSDRHVPTVVVGLTDIVEVATDSSPDGTGHHACARHRSGAISCWGRDAHGELGDGIASHTDCPTRSCSPTPVTVVLP